MSSNAWSRVWANGQYSEEIGMGVGVHQGSVFSPLRFILVLEAILLEFLTGVPHEFVYADDLVLIADTPEECISKIDVWKAGMESKGLHINMKKTKFLVFGIGIYVLTKNPVLSATVELQTIPLSACSVSCRFDKRQGAITGWVLADPNHVCPRFCGKPWPIDSRPVTQMDLEPPTADR